MRSITLKELRKKKARYFRNLREVNPHKLTRKQLAFIIKGVFQALPKDMQKYENNVDRTSQIYANILKSGSQTSVNIQMVVRQPLEFKKRAQGHGTLEQVYAEFRTKAYPVYSKYNSYLQRLGYSAKQYFMEHGDFDYVDSERNSPPTVLVTVELPAGKVVAYKTLQIQYWLAGQIDFARME